jgi:hypothetical protein
MRLLNAEELCQNVGMGDGLVYKIMSDGVALYICLAFAENTSDYGVLAVVSG